jgi:Tfp pilus assembly protein PilO
MSTTSKHSVSSPAPSRIRREAYGYLALALPCILLALGFHFIFAPGLKTVETLRGEADALSANVYESAWLDSTERHLKAQVAAAEQRLMRAKSRLLPIRPVQQTLDTLREAASQAGVEVLETQVATQRQDSLRTLSVKVHARGSYAGMWHWLRGMESQHAWWSVQEVILKPFNESTAGQSNAQLDILVLLQATGVHAAKPETTRGARP